MRPLLFKEMYADMSRMEREVSECGLDWIIVRPSTLTDDPASGRYILGIDRIPKGVARHARGRRRVHPRSA